jgi:hypothetical protein
MARLVVNPGSSAAWEIPLKPGVNSLGRGAVNDFKLSDPSISSSHCQIVIGPAGASIKDLGSTNGTFVNRVPIQEMALQSGQTIHLGGLEMMFYDEEAETAALTTPSAPAPPLRVPVGRTTLAVPRCAEAAAQQVATAVPPIPPSLATAPVTATGSQNCKHHPKSPGRFFCSKCQGYFCELCVTTRAAGGVQHKFCRHCGVECAPVQVRLSRPVQKGFFSSVPGVFIYPFRGGGFLILFAATLVFAALEHFRGIFSILITITAFGYLFSFMQTIIHSTVAGDTEMPALPGMDDVFAGCFRLLGCVLISFGLAIGLGCMAFFSEELSGNVTVGLIAAIAFGSFYFPMALLAVAMKDSVAAANPLVVMPAIFKVPLEYLVTVLLLGTAFGFRVLGGFVLTFFARDTYTTHSMSKLLLSIGLSAFWSFFVVYLLAVNMRTLGLLYLSKKEKFGWFTHY